MTTSSGVVIQGFFHHGSPRHVASWQETGAIQPLMPPSQTASSSRAKPHQLQSSPKTIVIQRFGTGEAFQLPVNLSNFGGGGGQPLPKSVRQKMESFFDASFADVRVHIGPQASSIGALAFTQGSNLYFAPGQYNPTSAHGQQLLGHELTHVLQQRAGQVRNPFGAGIAVVQDRGLEAEADRKGLEAVRFLTKPVGAISSDPPRGSQSVQTKIVQPRLKVGSSMNLTYSSFYKAITSSIDIQDISTSVGLSRFFDNNKKTIDQITYQISGMVGTVSSTKDADIKRILKKYLQSSGVAKTRLSSNTVNKEFTVNSWSELAQLVTYELKSESARQQEIVLAMLVQKSTRVRQSLDTAISLVFKLTRFLVDTRLARFDATEAAKHRADLNDQGYDPSKKFYHAFTQGSLSMKELAFKPTARTFEEGVVLLHDLLEVAYSVLKYMDTKNLLASGKHPLTPQNTKVTTGVGKREARSGTASGASVKFAKKYAMPVEVGPSFTTVRFCSINALLSEWTNIHKPLAKLSNRVMKDIVWAVFAYWTLSYRKSVGGAHCFFMINDAALNFGYEITKDNNYPTRKKAEQDLGTSWDTNLATILKARILRLQKGRDQASINEQGWTRRLPNPL